MLSGPHRRCRLLVPCRPCRRSIGGACASVAASDTPRLAPPATMQVAQLPGEQAAALAAAAAAAGSEEQAAEGGAPEPPSFLALRVAAAAHLRAHADAFRPFVLPEDAASKGEVAGADTGDAYEAYCAEVEGTAAWGGQVELQALAEVRARSRTRPAALPLPALPLGANQLLTCLQAAPPCAGALSRPSFAGPARAHCGLRRRHAPPGAGR